MSGRSYTRYTLRLAPQAGAGGAADRPGSDARSRQPVDEDWSGAPVPTAPDPAALQHLHPRAAELVSRLQPAGWQEDDGGDTLVFWLVQGCERESDVAAAVTELGGLGRLEVAREEPGWENGWRRFHRPQAIGRLYVRPPWYPRRDDLLDVVIDAGMAFGTGGHASTRQCLEEIQQIEPASLLDLGCGTGVVSFAALRLGFGPVTSVDIDPVAVQAAAGNAALNGLSPVLVVGDATAPGYPVPAAEVVVANIALRPILALARRVNDGDLARPAQLLLGGLLVAQGNEASRAFTGYDVASRRTSGEWLMLRLERTS